MKLHLDSSVLEHLDVKAVSKKAIEKAFKFVCGVGIDQVCEGLNLTARWALSLPPGHSQKSQIDDWWVIDLSVLYSLSGPRS